MSSSTVNQRSCQSDTAERNDEEDYHIKWKIKLCLKECLLEIKRLQDEQEELLCSLKASQSGFNRCTDACVVQDLTAMLASEDSIDGELEAEKEKVSSLNDQYTTRLSSRERSASNTSKWLSSVSSGPERMWEGSLFCTQKHSNHHSRYHSLHQY
ncbi:hypothetical protein EYF80_013183 [Liparis tanakae]|uniref:Uncharacterized protein n=1 Tax=Liparis tanakae TaxID=230148 RepID=A0A4Z2IH86_9TELE|nr:hypothetical protein EYF80_013183 [Liparis tanakae]